jgi:hypothetical protein
MLGGHAHGDGGQVRARPVEAHPVLQAADALQPAVAAIEEVFLAQH